jgi:hypothetical protein
MISPPGRHVCACEVLGEVHGYSVVFVFPKYSCSLLNLKYNQF